MKVRRCLLSLSGSSATSFVAVDVVAPDNIGLAWRTPAKISFIEGGFGAISTRECADQGDDGDDSHSDPEPGSSSAGSRIGIPGGSVRTGGIASGGVPLGGGIGAGLA